MSQYDHVSSRDDIALKNFMNWLRNIELVNRAYYEARSNEVALPCAIPNVHIWVFGGANTL